MTIATDIVNAGEALGPSTHTNIALVGPTGSGKTTVALTYPGRKLLFDFDNRAHSAQGFPNVDVLPCYERDRDNPNAWIRFKAYLTELVNYTRKGEPLPYDVIILAGLTAMGRIAMNWSLLLDPKRGLGNTPAKQHWWPQMNTIADQVLVACGLPCTTILEAHVDLYEEDTPEGKLHRFYPKVTGRMKEELPNWFSEIYYTRRHEVPRKDGKMGKELVYELITAGTGRIEFAKSSMNQLGRYWTDPVVVDFDQEPVGLAKLLALRYGVNVGSPVSSTIDDAPES